jgi:hypothetical protein
MAIQSPVLAALVAASIMSLLHVGQRGAECLPAEQVQLLPAAAGYADWAEPVLCSHVRCSERH